MSNDNTSVPTSWAASSWNSLTGYYQLINGSSNDCGATVSCVIYVNDAETITGTGCFVQALDYDIWAATYQARAYPLGNMGHDPDCESLTVDDDYPVFVISFDNENTAHVPYSWTSDQLKHIAIHELGHAMGLPDANVTCYQSGSTWYPLMNNGSFNNCTTASDYVHDAGLLQTPTSNEITTATYRAYLQ